MKKLFKLYVMEELDDGTTRQYYEELPPNGKWLTREEVENAMWGCGCDGFYNQLDENSIKRELDELFGVKP